MTTAGIRRLAGGETAACEQILRALPAWFGIEASIVAYVKDLATMETHVADLDGRIIGFITVNPRTAVSAEIHVMAVLAEHHGTGVGRALVLHVEALVAARGFEYLQVKTLGPSRESAEYARTRGFYERVGFRALEENELWGKANPCLFLVKHLGCAARA